MLRAWLYIGAICAAAVACSLTVVASVEPLRSHSFLPWPVLALCFAVAGVFPVEFHVGKQTVTADLVSLVLLVGLVTARPGELLLSVLFSCVVATVVLRWPLDRALFNTGSGVLGAALSLGMLHPLLGSTPVSSVSSWPRLALLLLVYETVAAVTVLGVITVTTGLVERQYLVGIGVQAGVMLPLNAGLGIIAVTIAWVQPWALIVFSFLGVALALWYRRANKIKQRFADLQKLYDFTARLAGATDGRELIAAALDEARRLLHCHQAAVYLPVDGETLCYRVREDGYVSGRSEAIPAPLASALGPDASLLVPRGKRTDVATAMGVEDMVAARLDFAEDGSGMLVLGDREGRAATFESGDRLLLEAISANFVTALTSTRRLDRWRSEMEARQEDARHDKLTGIANRSCFADWVDLALGQRSTAQMAAVILMDLDRFKEFNDTLGHHIGDLILQETAQRLQDAAGDSKLVARLGGDEFALLVPVAADADEVIAAAEAALKAVSKPIQTSGLVLEMHASAGIAVAPLHGFDQATLLKRAEIAMYDAKMSHRGIVTYDPAIDHNSTRRLQLATELRRALSAEELELYYQPVADLPHGQVQGLEALLRWRHHHYGNVSPNEFIPIAERTGLIGELTWWVLDKALNELRRWQDEGYDLNMAVNLSARTLLDGGLVERLRQMIEDIRVKPSNVTLEITESWIMLDPERSERVLRELADLGVKIAIDDFGTGYSSLSRLQRMPVHLVKIDRSFVMHMTADQKDEAIVRTTIDLAHNMGHQVIAEGVEDLTTWERLHELGCDQVQGYYLSPPVPAEDMRLWLRNRQPAGPIQRLATVRHLRSVSQGA